MKRRSLLIVGIIAAGVIAGSGAFAYLRYFGTQTVIQTNHDKDNCRQGNIFDGVDRQARFTVLSMCETAIGIVNDMKGTKEDDGDYQFNLQLENPYEKLLNAENTKQVNGMLVVEIIPKDQNSSEVQIPKNGDKIEVHGAWVTDNPHGWNEIHPAWKLKIL